MKKLNIDNVLVPIDFSALSIRAIEAAKRVARRFGARLHLAHIYHFDHAQDFGLVAMPILALPSSPEASEQHFSNRLKRLADKTGSSPVSCHARAGGPAYDELCDLANDIGADLIVMPTHSRLGLKHFLLGSTAERVVQHSTVPVLIARNTPTSIRKIVVPVDFSTRSLEGLKYAIQFAAEFGAEIIVIHAFYLGYIYTVDGQALYDLGALEEAGLKCAESQMSEFLSGVRFGPVKYRTAVRAGIPVDEICALAKAEHADLIITSTHGRTGFLHVLMGSVAERIVRQAECAVMTVPSNVETRRRRLEESRLNRSDRARPRRGRWMDRHLRSPGQRARANRKGKPFPERRRTNKFRESHLKT